jgi:hypothetical protein
MPDAAQLGNADLTAQALKNDADLVLGRMTVAGGSAGDPVDYAKAPPLEHEEKDFRIRIEDGRARISSMKNL